MGTADESHGPGRYRFDDYVVEEAAHTLLHAGQVRPLEPKAFAVLLALLRRPGELVGRDDLLDQVWGHRHVTPGVLTRAIAQLRSALGDDPQNPKYIQTRHALGYCFVGSLLPEPETVRDVPDAVAQASFANPVQGAGDNPSGGGDLPAKPAPARRRSSRALHWRPRHWLLASLLALAVLALSLWSTKEGPGRVADASIAVLPFTNLGPDRDQDYFAEGLAVEMHDALAGVPGLTVAAPVHAAVAAQLDGDVKAVGRRFGVATVLDASVRREGERIRINARLSDTATGYTLWSRSYDRELPGIFEIQSEIAGQVVESLLGSMPEGQDALRRQLAPTRSVAAFDDYLRGLSRLLSLASDEGAKAAIDDFNRALSVDAEFARAQAAICVTEARRFEYWHDAGAFERAKAACDRAERMAPASGEVRIARGTLLRVAGDNEAALAAYRSAADDRSVRADAHLGMAKALASLGRSVEARDEFARALALRPGDATMLAEIGYQRYVAGDVQGAKEAYAQSLALEPEHASRWNTLGFFHLQSSDEDEAEKAFTRSIAIRPNADALANIGTLRFHAGDHRAAAAHYRQAIELDPLDHVNWGNLGAALLAGGGAEGEIQDAFTQAAMRLGDYLVIRPSDGEASAALGWYRAVLGQQDEALRLVRLARSSAGNAAEIELHIADTFAALGMQGASEDAIRRAREAGMVETRIAAGLPLRTAASARHAAARTGGAPEQDNTPS